jgi:glycosyltransferase involved in cell wall biosynthesis
VFSFELNPVHYEHPWSHTQETRLSSLLKGDIKVAYLYEAPPKNTFRYRVYNMVQALNQSSRGFSASYFSGEEYGALSERVLDSIDIFVVSRVRYTAELNQLLTRARNKGKRTFFDIDDLLFDPDYTHLIVDTLDLPHTEETWNHWFSLISRMRASIQLCDELITTNAFLAEKLSQYFGKPVHVVPNFMNNEQTEISKKIFQLKKDGGWKRDKDITLGYFSGTQTHNKDFEVIVSALADLFAVDSRIKLRIGGHLNVCEPIDRYRDRLELLPFCDFVNLQSAVGRVDVNLVPLQENVFSNCKSELKYFEAAAVGTVTVATPVYTYSHAIEDGKNGFLSSSYDGFDKLSYLVAQLDEQPAIAEAAFKDSEQRYWLKPQISVLEHIFSV